jgi:hypothetical protein
MAVTHIAALRSDFANLATGTAVTYSAGASQKLIIYSGTPPANASAALSGNTAISTVTSLVWGAASAGVATLTSSTADSAAVGGTASFYRRVKSDGTSVIEQGLCGTSGSDMNLSALVVASGANVNVTSGSYTASP